MYAIEQKMQEVGFDFNSPNPAELNEEFYSLLVDFQNLINDVDIENASEEQLSRIEELDSKLVELFESTISVEEDEEIVTLKNQVTEKEKKTQQLEKEKQEAEEKAQKEAEEKEQLRLQKEAAERIAKEREEKLKAIEDKKQLEAEEKQYLLNNKKVFDYPTLFKLTGKDPEELPVRFDINGYVFEKRTYWKEYVIIQRPTKNQ